MTAVLAAGRLAGLLLLVAVLAVLGLALDYLEGRLP